MSVTNINAGTSVGGVSTASLTIPSFAATGADFIYLGVSQWRATDQAPTATFNGTSFTVHDSQTLSDSGGIRRVTIFKMVGPAQVSADIVVSWSGSVDEAVIGATAWAGVDQTTPLGTAVKNTVNGATTLSVTVTAASGGVTHDTYSGSADSTLGATTNRTQRWLDRAAINTTEGGGASTAGTGSGVAHTWSNVGQGGDPSVVSIVLIGVPINAATGTSISPTKGALALTGAAAIMALGMVAGAASAALAGATPSLIIGTVRAPVAATLALSGGQSFFDLKISPTQATLALTGNTPAVVQSAVRQPTGATLALTPATPYENLGMPAGGATLALSGATPTLFVGATFQPGAASLALSGTTPFEDLGILPVKAALALAGTTPQLNVGATSFPTAGTLVLSGTTPLFDLKIPAGVVSLALSPGTPSLVIDTQRVATGATLALTGRQPIEDLGLFPSGSTLGLSGGQPTSNLPVQFVPGAATLALTAGQPSLVISTVRAPSGVLLGLTPGQVSRLDLGIYPGIGTLNVTGGLASFNAGVAHARLIRVPFEARVLVVRDDNMAFLSSTYAAMILADGARDYWALGDSGPAVIHDSGPGANEWSGAANIQFGVPGPVSGVTAVFTTPNNQVFGSVSYSGLTAFTMEAWVNLNGLDQTATVVVLSDGKRTEIDVNAGGGIHALISINNVRQAWNSVGVIPVTGWHHLALTWSSGSVAQLYVDGVLDSNNGTGALTGVLNSYTTGYMGSAAGASPFLHGLLGQVALYPLALTAAQIARHSGQLTGSYVRFLDVPSET